MELSNVKNEAHRLIDKLPDSATWDDLMYEIYVRQSIDRGLADSEAGKVTEVRQVRRAVRTIAVKVVWTENAVAQLRAIYGYIVQDSQRYAIAMIDRLTSRSERLARHPESGSIVTEYDRADVREVIEGPYRVIYRIAADQIDVLSVVHGARQLPGDVMPP